VTPEQMHRTLVDLARPHGDIPVYGSQDWCDLPATDPRRFAAVVVAAECWRAEFTEERVRERLAEADLLAAVRCRAVSGDLAFWAGWSDEARRVPRDIIEAGRAGVAA